MGKFGAFVLGGVIGFAAGIFLAPKSGEENLADAKEFARDMIGQGQAYYQQGTDKVQARVSAVRSTADDKNDQLQAKIDAARKIISEQVAKNAEAAKQAIADAAEAADQVVAEATEVAGAEA